MKEQTKTAIIIALLVTIVILLAAMLLQNNRPQRRVDDFRPLTQDDMQRFDEKDAPISDASIPVSTEAPEWKAAISTTGVRYPAQFKTEELFYRGTPSGFVIQNGMDKVSLSMPAQVSCEFALGGTTRGEFCLDGYMVSGDGSAWSIQVMDWLKENN